MWKFDENFRSQFWAEAKYYYENGECLYLEGDIAKEAEKHQMDAMEKDSRMGILIEYLNMLLPENWNEMSLYERRSFIDGDALSPKGTIKRTQVSNIEIYSECFGKDPTNISRADSYSITAMMIQLPDWKKTEKSSRIPIYGKQRYYKKV